MAIKKITKVDYEKITIDQFRAVLKVIKLDDVKLVDRLDGEELRDFCKFCHQTFNNPFFDQIIQGFVFAQVMLTAEKGQGYDEYMQGKMMVSGMMVLSQYFQRYANKYESEYLKPAVDFDPHKSFSKQPLN